MTFVKAIRQRDHAALRGGAYSPKEVNVFCLLEDVGGALRFHKHSVAMIDRIAQEIEARFPGIGRESMTVRYIQQGESSYRANQTAVKIDLPAERVLAELDRFEIF